VGNWVADEILYQSHVHPEVKANELSEGEVKRLWECTRDICKVAVELNADASRFPENWLFRHRWVCRRLLLEEF
jgi:formamidopyrimidine-DNA glycosylase